MTDVKKLEIDISVFKEFLKKITVQGEMDMALLTTDGEGMKANLLTKSQVLNTRGILYKKMFRSYEEGVVLGIKDVNRTLKLINRLEGMAVLNISDHEAIIVTEQNGITKKPKISLAGEEFIENKFDKNLSENRDAGFDVDPSFIKEILENMKTLDTASINMEIKDSQFNVMVGEQGFDSMTYSTKVNYDKTATSKFGALTVGVFGVVGSKVKLSIDSDQPLLVDEIDEKFRIKYVIAPMKSDAPEATE